MFDYILKVLRLNFKETQEKDRNYFFNDRNEIVATTRENIIIMYYKVSKQVIWNHDGMAIVAIAKDFCIDNKKTNISFTSDVMLVEGLCGACNDAKLVGNFFLETCTNQDYWIKDLFPCKFGSCGNIKVDDGKYCLDICGQLLISDINVELVKSTREEFNLFILGAKKDEIQFVNYKEIYDYFCKKHEWFYTIGKNNVSSPAIREYDERRKTSTIDNYEMVTISKPIQLEFIIGSIFMKLDEIYFANSNKSLHTKKLEMYYFLTTLGFNKNEAFQFLSNYNFSIRKSTFKKLTKQKNG